MNESLLIVPAGSIPTLRSFYSQDANGDSVIQLGQTLFFPARDQVDTVTNIELQNGGAVPFLGGLELSFLVPEIGSRSELIAMVSLAAG